MKKSREEHSTPNQGKGVSEGVLGLLSWYVAAVVVNQAAPRAIAQMSNLCSFGVRGW